MLEFGLRLNGIALPGPARATHVIVALVKGAIAPHQLVASLDRPLGRRRHRNAAVAALAAVERTVSSHIDIGKRVTHRLIEEMRECAVAGGREMALCDD